MTEGYTLKEFFLNLIFWKNFLIKRWYQILITSIIGCLLGVLYSSLSKIKYTAKITFVLEENKNSTSSLGGLASLAGQFGVDVGNNSNSGFLSGDNILLYFKSPSLAREVLLTRSDSNSTETIASVYARVYDFKNDWIKKYKEGDVNFPLLESGKKCSRLQDSLLQVLINKILNENFSVSRTDKKTGFIDVLTVMDDEALAKIYCERIVETVVHRYIKIKTQRQQNSVDKLQYRVDSIANLLRQKTLASASLQNSSTVMDINPLFKTGTSVAVETNLRDKTLLATIFANVTQNLEIAKFTLNQETPVIQIIDAPILPLKKDKLSVLKTSLIFFFLSMIIFSVYLIFRKLIIELMK